MSKIAKTKNEMLNGFMMWLQNAHQFTDLTSETLELNKMMYNSSGNDGDSKECIEMQQKVLEMYFTTMNGKIHDVIKEMIEVIESNGVSAEEVEKSCQPHEVEHRAPSREYMN
jgi:hypothetical protein